MERFDVVVYGATGFTGRQAARYLGEHSDVRFAIAGRSREKLEALRAELPRDVGVIVADAEDAGTIDGMVRQTRVVASFAGPFALYSDPVVAACAERGVHYVDITGETSWARTLIDRFHGRAREAGAKIVPFCGFDSVPSDLGTWVVVDWIRRTWGQPTRRVSASFAGGGGGVNGGTVASALATAERGDTRKLAHTGLLDPPGTQLPRWYDHRSVTWDADRGRWLAPFVMGPVNARVVRRSAALYAAWGTPYGESLDYDESMEVKSRWKGLGIALGLVSTVALLNTRPGRALVRRMMPEPGEGPSDEAMDRGHVRVRYVAEAEDGRRALGTLNAQGDAGNRVTVRMACESALALLRPDELPGGAARAGLLTPATAFGPVLVERLRAVGITLEVEPLGE